MIASMMSSRPSSVWAWSLSNWVDWASLMTTDRRLMWSRVLTRPSAYRRRIVSWLVGVVLGCRSANLLMEMVGVGLVEALMEGAKSLCESVISWMSASSSSSSESLGGSVAAVVAGVDELRGPMTNHPFVSVGGGRGGVVNDVGEVWRPRVWFGAGSSWGMLGGMTAVASCC